MNGLSCKNESCHSCGRPHPNCRCYAKGGNVTSNEITWDDEQEKKPLLQSGAPQEKIKWDDEGEATSAGEIKWDDEKKYDSFGQQFLTGIEGAAQGLAGPLATLAETKLLGITPEDIKGRAKANPWTHGLVEAGTFGASLLAPTGILGATAKTAAAFTKVGVAGKLGSAAVKYAKLGEIGSTAIRAGIETASFAGADEITKAMLAQPNSDPEQPVGAALLHVGFSGIMGAATGGLFTLGEGLIGKGLEKLQNEKVVNAAHEFLFKMGSKPDPLGLGKAVNETITDIAAGNVAMFVPSVPGKIASYPVIRKYLRPYVENITKKPIGKANEYIIDAFAKSIIANEISGLPNAVHYASQVAKGTLLAADKIEAIFKGVASPAIEPLSDEVYNTVHDFIASGQVGRQMQNEQENQAPQAFAEGGSVSPISSNSSDKFASIFPEQNVLLNAAKGRVAGYLNQIRPLPNQSKLPFDPKPSETDKTKEYRKAVDLAANPLKILDHVNRGSLTPQDMKHFTQMYPEVYRFLSKGMTKRIIEAQLKGEKPPYAKRQSMSLFLGTPLDSTLTPEALQAVQGVFAQKKAATQGAASQRKGKRGSSSALVKTSQGFLTDDQARERRQQSSKV